MSQHTRGVTINLAKGARECVDCGAVVTEGFMPEGIIGVDMQQTFQATGDDVQEFAELTGDDNEIHVDADAAEESIFGERVAHGVLGLSWVSSMLAEFGDGTTVLTGMDDVSFIKPIRLNEEVEITLYEQETGDGWGKIMFTATGSGEMKLEGIADVMYVEDDNE